MISGLIITFTALFGPAFFLPHLFIDLRVWALFIMLAIIILTHPKMSFEKLGVDAKSEKDKRSLLLINLAAYLSILPIYGVYILTAEERTISNIQLSHMEIAGIFIGVFSVTFRWYSIKLLGIFFTSEVIIQENHKLIQSGPYHYIRHPGYTGSILLFVIAVPLIFGSPFLIFWTSIIVIPIYIYRIKVEEAALKEKFGIEYEEYQNRTNALIPYIF